MKLLETARKEKVTYYKYMLARLLTNNVKITLPFVTSKEDMIILAFKSVGFVQLNPVRNIYVLLMLCPTILVHFGNEIYSKAIV